MPMVQVALGEKVFEFSSFTRWVNKAQGWFAAYGLTGRDVICLDTKGRICTIGADFMRARDDDAYPVTVYYKNPDASAPDTLEGKPHETIDNHS